MLSSISSPFFLLLCLLSYDILAEEEIDWDLEYGFSIYQKSTIDDFPLEEIGQEALSDAVIEGALEASSNKNFNVTGKPIYVVQKEKNDKQQVQDLPLPDGSLSADELRKLSKNLPELPIFTPLPYTPLSAGGAHDVHNSTTVERP